MNETARRILRPILGPLYRHVAYVLPARRRLRQQTRQRPLRLILGAGLTQYPGWIPTDIWALDITRPDDWARYLEPASAEAMLAEHVWEHLTPDQALTAARLCFRYLRSGGYLRVAVPDGLVPDPWFVDYIRPGTDNPAAEGHQVLYTCRTFTDVFERAGFRVESLEWFDETGEFHRRDWDLADGPIRRRFGGEDRRTPGGYHFASIILDARKP
jgi:predicted SAM-dependent methyltransferase